MKRTELVARLQHGWVIPALPLALDENRRWSERHQRALLRYYLAAGAGGVAVAVHSTQFQIREPRHGLFEPVLALASETLQAGRATGAEPLRIAGLCGRTAQAMEEAALVRQLGYHAGLLSLAAWRNAPEAEVLRHCQTVGEQIPLIGFYLQESVGGRRFSYDFWRNFLEIPSVVAVKMAPFNRYHTLDVVRAVLDSGRRDVALYTGNDDNIVLDLMTPFGPPGDPRFVAGGLLGQWGVWTQRAVDWLERIKVERAGGEGGVSREWLRRNTALTDANGVIFDVAHNFAGCIPGIHEVLRRQGLMASAHCLDPEAVLSPGQAAALDRIAAMYPELTDDAFVEEHRDAWLR